MEIKIINDASECNNYLIINNGEAVLVDCSCNSESLEYALGENILKAIVITHGHFDHFLTINKVLRKHNAKVYLHKNAFEKLNNENLNASTYFRELIKCNVDIEKCVFVKENIDYEIINGINCKFYYAFGHTDDSILMQIENNLFVGDFVFENGYGRTDLPTGSFLEFRRSYKKHQELLKNNKLYYGH